MNNPIESNLKSIEPELIIDCDFGAGIYPGPQGSGRFALVGGGKVKIFESRKQIAEFKIGPNVLECKLHPTKELVAVRFWEQPYINFYDFSGNELKSAPIVCVDRAFNGPAFIFDSQGNFIFGGMTKQPQDDSLDGDFVFAYWSSTQPPKDLLEISAAKQVIFFGDHRAPYPTGCIGTGATFLRDPHGDFIWYLAHDAHNGTADYQRMEITDSKIQFGPFINWISRGVAYSPDKPQFVTLLEQGLWHYYFHQFQYDQPCSRPARTFLPEFEMTGTPVLWLDLERDDDDHEDQDGPSYSTFYLDGRLVLHSTEYGRIQVLDARKMSLLGEI